MTAAFRFCGSVGGEFRKGTTASARLDARCFSFLQYASDAFQAATSVLDLTGSESEEVSPCVGSPRRTAPGSSSFFRRLSTCWFLQPEVVETYIPGTRTLG